jgi:hypothetical protein
MSEPKFLSSPLYVCGECGLGRVRLWVALNTVTSSAPELYCAAHRPAGSRSVPAVPLISTATELALFGDTRRFPCPAWDALSDGQKEKNEKSATVAQ